MEMTTEPKLSPCWLCGNAPETYERKRTLTADVDIVAECANPSCVVRHSLPALVLEYWNEYQQAILARRKADFIDGARANGIGNRGPTKEMIEKLFELYLAKEREK